MSVAPAESPPAKPAPGGLEKIQSLIERIESFPDADSRDLMQECLFSVLEFYGSGMERVMDLVEDEPGARAKLLDDELVRSLLFVHGLHPVPLEERLAGALATVRPYMASHGGDIELVSLEDGVATFRLQGHCKTCPSSTATMELGVRRSIEEACPDLLAIELENAALVDEARFRLPAGAPAWHVLGSDEDLGDSALQSRQVNGSRVLLCMVRGQRYAYRDFCPLCLASLGGGNLDDQLLSCPAGHRFDLRRAGISPDSPGVHLDPFPLVSAGGMVKVAVD